MAAQNAETVKALGIDGPRAPSSFEQAEETKNALKAIGATYDPDDGLSNVDEIMELSTTLQKISGARFKALDLGFDMPSGERLVSVEAGEAASKISKLFLGLGGLHGPGADYNKGISDYIKAFDFSKVT